MTKNGLLSCKCRQFTEIGSSVSSPDKSYSHGCAAVQRKIRRLVYNFLSTQQFLKRTKENTCIYNGIVLQFIGNN